MSRHRPTIDDVARLAGVSIKTVSRVFNKEPHVRPATHERVMVAAAKLEYRPNLSARRLAANRAYVIAMLYDNPKAPDYVAEVQHGALSACRARNYDLLLHPCDARSPSLIDEVLDLHHQATVDGFVVLQPVSDIQELNRRIARRDLDGARNHLEALRLRGRRPHQVVRLRHHRIAGARSRLPGEAQPPPAGALAETVATAERIRLARFVFVSTIRRKERR